MLPTKVSAKGQVLIPKAMRTAAGIRPGGRVYLVATAGEVTLRAVPADPVGAGFGLAKGKASLTEALRAERMRDRAGEEKLRPR